MKVRLSIDQAKQVRRALATDLKEDADFVVLLIKDGKIQVRVHNRCLVTDIEDKVSIL